MLARSSRRNPEIGRRGIPQTSKRKAFSVRARTFSDRMDAFSPKIVGSASVEVPILDNSGGGSNLRLKNVFFFFHCFIETCKLVTVYHLSALAESTIAIQLLRV